MFDPAELKARCNGMLTVGTYRRLHDTARAAAMANPEAIVVEVGTAHAAGTVALASGMVAGGGRGKVYSFEKITGGSRERFGGIDENTRIIVGNIAHFGLTDRIEVLFGDVADLHARIPPGPAIGLLMLDADGRIDRDFRLFYDRVLPGAPIIIDDVQDAVWTRTVNKRGPVHDVKIDQKHRLSRMLVDLFIARGLIKGQVDGITWFGTKSDAAWASVPPEAVLDVYRSLVFAQSVYQVRPGLRLAQRVKERLPPGLRKRLARIRAGLKGSAPGAA